MSGCYEAQWPLGTGLGWWQSQVQGQAGKKRLTDQGLVPSGPLWMIQIGNTVFHFWNKSAHRHPYHEGFLFCRCVCQIILITKTWRHQAEASALIQHFPRAVDSKANQALCNSSTVLLIEKTTHSLSFRSHEPFFFFSIRNAHFFS